MKLFDRKGRPASDSRAEKMYRAGMSMLEGEDDPGAADDAAEKFREAAEAGHTEAQYMLGYCHHRSFMHGRSYETAAYWYSKAAEKGHAGAQYALGQMYENGHGVPQSMSEAASMYLKAAGNGHAQAQLSYGELCERGYADGDAAYWYSKAAEQGLGPASEALERFRTAKHRQQKAWPQRLTPHPAPSLPFRSSTLLSRKRQPLKVRLLPSGPDPVPPIRREQRPSGRLPRLLRLYRTRYHCHSMGLMVQRGRPLLSPPHIDDFGYRTRQTPRPSQTVAV